MIKINLLKDDNDTSTQMSGLDGTFVTRTMHRGRGRSGTQALVSRFLFLILPLLGLLGYQKFEAMQFEETLTGLQRSLQKLNIESKKYEGNFKKIQGYIKEKEKLDTEIDLLKGLSLKRYQALKVFDSLQSVIPNDAWLLELDISGRSITLKGNATDDSVVTALMQTLEESLYFQNVSWIDSKEVEDAFRKGRIVKEFKVKMELENI